MLSFLELTEEDCFGHANAFHPCDVAGPVQLHLKLMDSMLGRLTLLRTSSFASWSCHLMPRTECKQH